MSMMKNIDYDRVKREARNRLRHQWSEDNGRVFNVMLRADEAGHTVWVKAIDAMREQYIEDGMDETVDALLDFEYEQEDPYGSRCLRRSDF